MNRDLLIAWDGPDLATVVDNGDGTYTATLQDGTELTLYASAGSDADTILTINGNEFIPADLTDETNLVVFITRSSSWPGVKDWMGLVEPYEFVITLPTDTDNDNPTFASSMLVGSSALGLDQSGGFKTDDSLKLTTSCTLRSCITVYDETGQSDIFRYAGPSDAEDDNYLYQHEINPGEFVFFIESGAGTNLSGGWFIPYLDPERSYVFSTVRDSSGTVTAYLNGRRLGYVTTVSGSGVADDGNGNIDGLAASGGDTSGLQIIDSQDFGVIFVMVLSDEKTEANELAFVQDNNLDFTAEEQGFLLWDDFDTVSGEADTVVLFKPDNSANGVTELQGVYGSGDFASTGDGKQVLDDKYWLVNTTHQTNIVAGGIIIGDLTIDALCMYNLSTTYILSSRSSGESAATDYNFEVRVSNSTDFTVFFEADTSNYTFVYELPDENGLKRNEPFWVKFIREDNGDGTANHYLLVKRIGDDDYKFLRVGSISDNTDTAELSPSGTYVTSDFSTDSSSNYLYFAQGTSPIRMISMKDSAIVPDHENASATYYSTVAAAVAAANSVAHEEGDLVGVSWEADDYTDAWSTYGTVQADGSISPDLLSFDGGIPFKALGFTFSTYDGDAIPLNGDGYPEFDTTVLTQYSALQVEGLTINGILDCEVHVETDLDSIPNDAANSIIGFGVIQQAPDSGDSYVGIRKVSGIIYRFFEQDDGETQQASLGITSLKGGLRFNTFIRNNSPLGTAEPNIYLGVQERSPDYTTSQASADWETRHGDWTSGDGPESIIVLYGYDSSVAGTGTGTFTRLRLTANSITYD